VNGKELQRDEKRKQQEEEYQASLQDRTSLRLGDLTYQLVLTELDPEWQVAELEKALKEVEFAPSRRAMLLSPTPSKPIFEYHGYQIFDAQHHGTTSTVSLGYEQSSGKQIVVKMVKCHRSQFEALKREIDILHRLNHVKVPAPPTCRT
jgi:hypothetical protein